ncbi:sensor histidine kinase [Dactylosporangium vinaceum]|uniref:Oxygen sensor histidine kinase NreB n=1 Tax=Dactylosporangium vinaceum TaxID=53362 RepID=A0ABV5LZL9_9ACTN|nr:sensor histidine kinase [Dactylosporangium vinaceum]UAB94689.1 sensor histidine kinase [Dactylosporangium vinaceum]
MNAAFVLDSRGSLVAGVDDRVDRAVALRAMASGRPVRKRRVTYLPVAGGLLGARSRLSVLRRFVPLAELVLAERARLARDLHDSVVQTLYGISLGADTAAELLHGNPAHAGESLAWIKETATAGLSDIRGIILRLRSDADAGLIATLRNAFNTPGLHLELDADAVMSPPVEEALYRIALEALGNAARHAEAARVTVRLAAEGRRVVLEVADNGVGFVPSAAFPGRLGLRSMRERAELLGGTLDIRSAPGAGTVVRAALPAG